MSLKARALVFVTFFGSCLAVGLLLASLTTEYWVVGSAKNINSPKSIGSIHYGLFTGTKNLNVGYGNRTSAVEVVEFVRNEPDVINFWLWLGTALGTGFALLSSAVGAIVAVLKAASASKKKSTMLLLFISNVSSASSHVLAFICWLVQFYLYLVHNVLTIKDRQLNWYSHGLSELGTSFYFIVVSALVVIINVIILIIAHKNEKRERERFETPSEEKAQGVIMLY